MNPAQFERAFTKYVLPWQNSYTSFFCLTWRIGAALNIVAWETTSTAMILLSLQRLSSGDLSVKEERNFGALFVAMGGGTR